MKIFANSGNKNIMLSVNHHKVVIAPYDRNRIIDYFISICTDPVARDALHKARRQDSHRCGTEAFDVATTEDWVIDTHKKG